MASEQRIRQATSDDVGSLLDIYTPVVLKSATSFELTPPTHDEFALRVARVSLTDPWLVLERDGAIAGYAYASEFRGRPAYQQTRETTVYVSPEHQRSGVGESLMVALLDELQQRGAHLVVACLTLPNEASVRFHEALGYSYVGTFHEAGRKFDAWHDVGFWERRLGD